MARNGFLEALEDHAMVGDGAIGTELYHRGASLSLNYDQLNLSNRPLVGEIHSNYIEAGAELLETNTFGANRVRLEQHGLADKLTEINAAGARLALAAAAGRAFVAGAVGPLPATELGQEYVERSPDEAYEVYREQIVALADAGVDLIILETFTDLTELHQALRAAKERTDLPVIAQLAFHHRAVTPTGVDIFTALQGLADAGADVVGTNCGRGVSNVLHIVEEFGSFSAAKISAFANAGFPEQVGGRIMYLATPEYMATMAERMVEAGANLVGGCCGTGPAVITAIAERIKGRKPAERRLRPVPRAPSVKPPIAPPKRKTCLDRVDEKKLIVVEIDPPFGLDYERVVDGCRLLRDAGVDGITTGDSPLAALRMSNISMASIVQREVGVECIIHVCCRDRNVIGLQGDLMGAWALGIRSVLVITGDPAKIGNQPGASSVYDLNSIGLIKVIRGLNDGVNFAGASIRRATGFNIGCGFNPNHQDLGSEVRKLVRKVEAGARFALTQLIFDSRRFSESVGMARDAGVTVPILPAIFPLLSHRNAEFIHNELPGARLPEWVMQRMSRADKKAAPKEGLAIAKQLIEEIWEHGSGCYIVPPLDRYELAAELVEFVHSALGVTA